jgi:hypothetical protein
MWRRAISMVQGYGKGVGVNDAGETCASLAEAPPDQ